MSQQPKDQQQGSASPSPDRARASFSDSETGPDQTSPHEVFEDAPDASSVRSLTNRQASAARSTQQDAADSDDGRDSPTNATDKNSESEVKEGSKASEREGQDDAVDHRPDSSASLKRFSTTSNLDNIDLDDDSPAAAVEDPKSPTENPHPRTISLSNIASALPNMPWSPSAEATPSRNLNALPTAVVPQGPPQSTPTATNTAAAAAPPPPPPRKLTSPFSWLSRSSSKEKESTPTGNQTSPRRNTASSVATLTSNPDMLLSRLEEETDEQARRDSLKSRFKLLRLREEAGITAPLVDDTKGQAGDKSVAQDALLAEAPPPSSVPEPDSTMPAGTMSGVHAGPSAMPETEVDWDLWQSVVYEGPAAVARTSAAELNRAIATGIPSAIRGVIWQVLAQSKNDELELVYKDLVLRGTEKDKARNSNSTITTTGSNATLSVHSGDAVASSSSSIHSDHSGAAGSSSSQPDKANAVESKKKEKEDLAALQKLEKTIRRDLGARTSYSKYAAAAGLQEGLFGVCKAYALYDEGVGYAQGMNFLIMPLLFNMPEEEAFCLLVRLMQNHGLRDLFIQDMPGLHMRLYQFERLLEDFEPALYCHLHRRGISSHLYATQWFLTLFAYRFPLQLVLRIYDLILSEGLSAILRFGLVLMQKNAATLLSMSDMQQLTVFLKDKLFDAYIDKDPSQGSLLESGFFGSSSSNMEKEVYRADQLIRDACEIKISPETLKAYGLEWEEKTRAEKQRETELFELRHANQHLAVKVRKLEERVEVCDREQAALATEMVHAKVENEELKDENESLKGQVRELKLVIEQQPQEIEEKWSLEREDLMKRNLKVHEENEELEKTLQELEEQLVQTKMRYAEINSQHETLTRKWSDLKRQFA